jgi:hypothetical protein
LAVYQDSDAHREATLTQHLLGEPAHALGAYSEALSPLGLAELRLVSPGIDDPCNAARARAAGRALIRLERHERAERYPAEVLQRLRDPGSVGEQVRVLGYQVELADAVGDSVARDRLLGKAHA